MQILGCLVFVKIVTQQTETRVYRDLEILLLNLLRKLKHNLKKIVPM